MLSYLYINNKALGSILLSFTKINNRIFVYVVFFVYICEIIKQNKYKIMKTNELTINK